MSGRDLRVMGLTLVSSWMGQCGYQALTKNSYAAWVLFVLAGAVAGLVVGGAGVVWLASIIHGAWQAYRRPWEARK